MSSKRRSRNLLKHRSSDLDLLTQPPHSSQNVPIKRTWSVHDIKNIKAMTPMQADMIRSFAEGQHVCAIGSAGVGKTFLALYLALTSLFDENLHFDKIMIVRSAVPSRDMGFMPGTLEEKTAYYEGPYQDICEELLGRKNSYRDLKTAGKIDFITTSFVRGLTFDNSLIILDECQSANFNELYSVLTRVGRGSRVIICGDGKQNDLHSKRGTEQSGFEKLVNICEDMKDIDVITFTEHDIVRSGFVKSFIINCQQRGY